MFKFLGDKKLRLGLALSGGGARGFAHAGAIKAMEEVGVRPDIIAGVSAGSVVAVMYAAGMTPEAILAAFGEVSFMDFCKLSVPKNGFFNMDGFKKFIRRHVPYENLEDLPIPTYIGATDIDHGTAAVFSTGNVADAVAASCSIPIIFQPQKIDGTHYVDGGVLHNLPSWIIRDKCRYLFGVNVSPVVNTAFRNTLMDIAQRTYNLLVKNNANPDMELCDLVIETRDIAHYKVFDLRGIRRVYRTGYQNAMEALLDNGFRRVNSPGSKPSTPNSELPTPNL